MSKNYQALWVTKSDEGEFSTRIAQRSTDDLPAGDVLVRVAYSSINFKDMLSTQGHPGVTRNFPHQPGIDAAGVVEECGNAQFQPGDEVIVTGYDLGMGTAGGLGQYIRVPAEWVIPMPPGLSANTPTPPVAPVTATSPSPGAAPILISLSRHRALVKPAVP